MHLANNKPTDIEACGTIKIASKDAIFKLEDTLYVPGLRSNLLSVPKFTDHGMVVVFTKENAFDKVK